VLFLIVDDDSEILDFIAEVIEELGAPFKKVTNVPDALKHLKSVKTEFVICDLNLISGKGESVYNYLRKAYEGGTNIPFLFISGEQKPNVTLDELSAFLEKPFSGEELKEAIKSLYKKYRAKNPKTDNTEKSGVHPSLKKMLQSRH